MEVVFGNRQIFALDHSIPVQEIKELLNKKLGLTSNQFYLMSNGRKVSDFGSGKVEVVLTLLGGKGGFGSMLRAIGAQIEKTTNREACRDLSGRRLRDINEEQRLKKWVTQQAEREKEAKEKKKKKLEKLLEQPKHEFKDEEYDKERSALPEKVEDAVLKGLEASCSSTKRKTDDKSSKIVKKKPKLWLDSELDEDLSSDSESEDDNQPKPDQHCSKLDKQTVQTEDPALIDNNEQSKEDSSDKIIENKNCGNSEEKSPQSVLKEDSGCSDNNSLSKEEPSSKISKETSTNIISEKEK